MQQNVCILGATGSIGTSTLDVIRRNRAEYRVAVLTANHNWQLLLEQAIEFQPEKLVIADEKAGVSLQQAVQDNGLACAVKVGREAVEQAALSEGLTTVVAAIVGAAGLVPTLNAVKQGLKVLLANKEALVMSGALFMQAVAASGAILLPVDSEHNAIFQSLPAADSTGKSNLAGVSKILLTGSGGPFRQLPLTQFKAITPAQACAHPNWDMGQKISVDSATMMNKGLELIEACYLFDVTAAQIDIVVHPQSIIHSMVAYQDGSVIAQMGNPDMRTPIAHTLAWPERIDAGVAPLDFYQLSHLEFSAPDLQRFPCLALAQRALTLPGNVPCVLNAANEVAVAAFLQGTIAFTAIATVIEQTMAQHIGVETPDIAAVIALDKAARQTAEALISQGNG